MRCDGMRWDAMGRDGTATKGDETALPSPGSPVNHGSIREDVYEGPSQDRITFYARCDMR